MEKLDILIGEFVANVGGNGAADTVRNKFTVNTAVNEVSINVAAAAWYYIFRKPISGARYLYARDNVRILSAGIFFPHGFGTGKVAPILSLERWVERQSGATYVEAVPELQDFASTTSEINYPFANYECALDVFSSFPAQTAGTTNSIKYFFRGIIAAGDVSMLNAPAASNGQVYTPVPFLKVLHTRSMGLI